MCSPGFGTAGLDTESPSVHHGAHIPSKGWTLWKGSPSLLDTSFLAPSPSEQFQLCPQNYRQGGATVSTQVMAWGQGVQDSDQPPGMVPALAVSWCPQSSLPLTQEGRAPTCLALGPQEALGTVASKGPREVLAGPAVLAGLRLALVNIWGPAGRKAPAQHRDSWWLGTGAWTCSTSPTGHRPFPMSHASPSPVARNIPAPGYPLPHVCP